METNPVRLMHFDPRWRQEFEQTRSSILQSCEGRVVDVVHIGSTAISGLIARPTLDLLAGVSEADMMERAALLIEGLNYRRVASPLWAGSCITLCKPRYVTPDPPDPTHCVYLMMAMSPAWVEAVSIRDYLRQNAESAVDFEAAKVKRWRRGEGDLERYNADKAIFFAHLKDQIDAT
ncbi:dephospho-CoA kinase/protein folding accessory domain-containing protein [Novipirellula galeiformis]|uniref:Dephospho-CoA kinase/protein folding accessory domain-containing protein n=1 Tax=Novipirellula galeiformis TaxID=2528004 RepID=A0A5C6CKS3_9BACT|nr:GrpB family protein [Novipirellula galeiformis]TWU24157.1 dephospho-CoA kinase/protein folding accessory domain-containing protein [Novipirellula galeiformis]